VNEYQYEGQIEEGVDGRFYDDDQLGDPCPKCEDLMLRRDCTGIGCNDGFYDGYEDDPLWYDPGDLVRCGDCDGRGFFEWCPNKACPGNNP
jgi:hypothetical protein